MKLNLNMIPNHVTRIFRKDVQNSLNMKSPKLSSTTTLLIITSLTGFQDNFISALRSNLARLFSETQELQGNRRRPLCKPSKVESFFS